MSETAKTRKRLLTIPGVDEVLQSDSVNILDIGAGDDKLCPTAIGLDREAWPGVNLVWKMPPEGDLPFAEDLFDVVYSSHTLEDFQQTFRVLKSWWRVVKRGGYLVLYLPHADWYPNIGHPMANKAHKHDLRPEDIEAHREFLSPTPEVVHVSEHGPPNGEYVYERRGEIEYSFLVVWRKPE